MLYMYDKELVIEILTQISDAGEIYFVCENKLGELGVTIDKIRDDLK